MRQTPFGVWNMSAGRQTLNDMETPMRQTPFGVWNFHCVCDMPLVSTASNEADAFWRLEFRPPTAAWRGLSLPPMRQTPFGVWNSSGGLPALNCRPSSNEADAFWRLEFFTTSCRCALRIGISNEADAFWRLEFTSRNAARTAARFLQ